MRGGTVDGYFFGVSFVQQIGQERWEDAMTGSSHSRAGVAGVRGYFQNGVYGVIFCMFACRARKRREEATSSL